MLDSGPVSVCNGQYAAFQTEQCLYAALLVRQNLGTCVFEMPQCKLQMMIVYLQSLCKVKSEKERERKIDIQKYMEREGTRARDLSSRPDIHLFSTPLDCFGLGQVTSQIRLARREREREKERERATERERERERYIP